MVLIFYFLCLTIILVLKIVRLFVYSFFKSYFVDVNNLSQNNMKMLTHLNLFLNLHLECSQGSSIQRALT